MTIEEYLNEVIDSLNTDLLDSDILRISEEMSQKLCEYNNYTGDHEEFKLKIYDLIYDYLNGVINKEEFIDNINYQIDVFISGEPLDFESDEYIETPEVESNGLNDEFAAYDDEYVDDTSFVDNTYYDEGIANSYSDNSSFNNWSNNQVGGTNSYVSKRDNSAGNNQGSSNYASNIVTDITVEEISMMAPKYSEIEKIVDNSIVGSSISYHAVQKEVGQLKKLVSDTKLNVESLLEDIKKSLTEIVSKVVGIDEEIIAPIISDNGITSGDTTNGKSLSFMNISLLTSNKNTGSSIKRADSEFFQKCGYQVNSDGLVTIDDFEYNSTTGELINKASGTSSFVNYYIPEESIDDNYKLSMSNTITCLLNSGELDLNSVSGNISNYKSDAIIVLPNSDSTLNGIIDSTTFATIFAHQQVEGCHNIIGGCGDGSASALKIATEQIYDTAFCVNHCNDTSNQLLNSEINDLNSKTIVFVESKDNSNYSDAVTSAKDLGKNNNNVYFITNDNSSYIDNVHLLNNDSWNSFTNNKNHSSNYELLNDVINSGLFNKNIYY